MILVLAGILGIAAVGLLGWMLEVDRATILGLALMTPAVCGAIHICRVAGHVPPPSTDGPPA